MAVLRPPLAFVALCFIASPASAQGNYEIQVYPGATVEPGITMFELHSNYTSRGTPSGPGFIGSNHALHETIEITHGFSDWFELGYYNFMSITSGDGFQWVGTHLRPRIAIPEKWNWPVGLSLSQEIGYQRKEFTDETWNYEIRPIIDQKVGRFYWAVNPVLGLSLSGPDKGKAPSFEPQMQVGFDVTKKVNLALEYYGENGPLGDFDPIKTTQQMLFPAVNIDFGPEWEFNLGAGVTLTQPTELVTFKMIMGRRLGGKKVQK